MNGAFRRAIRRVMGNGFSWHDRTERSRARDRRREGRQDGRSWFCVAMAHPLRIYNCHLYVFPFGSPGSLRDLYAREVGGMPAEGWMPMRILRE